MSAKVEVKRWLRQIRSRDSGSALVEAALTFPLFLALLLGAVELGDFAYKSDEITNAARSAAQYAATGGGGYVDCNGSVPGSTAATCSSSGGIYATAQNDAPLVYKACTNFTVQEATSCTCSDGSGACGSSSTSGYACATGKPVMMVQVYTSAQCSPAASVPNLFGSASLFTLNGYAQQEVTE